MVTNQLSFATFINVTFDQEIRAPLILCSLPESYNDLVMDVSNFVSSSNTLKFDNVVGVVLSDEICRKSSSGSTSRSVLNAESRGGSMEWKLF